MLIQLWMGQGYIKSSSDSSSQPSSSSSCLQDVGLEYFKDLYWRSFFQQVEKDEGGNILCCKMHDLMHDLAVAVAGEESTIFSISNSKDSRHDVNLHIRHLSFDFQWTSPAPWQLPRGLVKEARKLRTFLKTNFGWRGRSLGGGGECETIFSNMTNLRVLDLSSAAILILPPSIAKLKHLRYLDLSYNTEMETVPEEITRLANLLLLNLDGCFRLTQLPKDIGKLLNLAYLGLFNCSCLTHMPVGIGQLHSLTHLPLFVLVKTDSGFNAAGIGELQHLNNIRGTLEISNLQYVRNKSEAEAANLKDKQHLRGLELSWNPWSDYDTLRDEASIEALRPPPNLKELCLRGYCGLKFPRWLSSVTSLVEIIIQHCKNCQWLPPLDQLPFLRQLRVSHLKALEYVDNGMLSASSRQSEGGKSSSSSSSSSSSPLPFFPSLKSLELHDCPNLQGWWMAELLPHFPCLFQLEIDGCPNLTSIPHFSLHLEHLILKNGGKELLNQMLITPSLSSSSSSPSPPFSRLQCLSISRFYDLDILLEEISLQLTSLKKLDIWFCPELRTLSPAMQHLTSLQKLNIWNCEGLDLCDGSNDDDSMQLEVLGCLRSLRIRGIPKLVSLPNWLHRCSDLQNLHIGNCCNLMFLPEWLPKLTAIQSLQIDGCDKLKKRCGNSVAEDWPKIAHIPNIRINDATIQKNGCYQLSEEEQVQEEGEVEEEEEVIGEDEEEEGERAEERGEEKTSQVLRYILLLSL